MKYRNETGLNNSSVANNSEMKRLEDLCASHIGTSLRKDNVCYFMNEAVNSKSTVLQDKCREYFSTQRTLDILRDPSFLKLTAPALSALLDADRGRVPEIVLFKCLKIWMRHKCRENQLPVTGETMRQVIGDALYKIRFPVMSVDDFANYVSVIDGLLTNSEMARVFQMITLFDTSEVDCPFPTGLAPVQLVEHVESQQ